VALGGYPPKAPTDPDVLTLEHPVPQVTPSLRRRHDAAANPSLAIRWRFGDTKREFNASQVFLANDVVTRCLASHPPGSCGSSSPDSSVLSRHCDFPPPIPPRFVAAAWQYHGITHISLPPPLRAATSGLGLFTRYPLPGILPWRRQDLPSSWGISLVRLHMFLPTPAGLLTPDYYGAAAWPLDPQVQRLPRKVFRRPIAWLSDSLSTPRRADYSDPTQDSLPAAGQALPDGLSTHKIPMSGFKIVSLHLYPPLPSFAWRNGGDRRKQIGRPCFREYIGSLGTVTKRMA